MKQRKLRKTKTDPLQKTISGGRNYETIKFTQKLQTPTVPKEGLVLLYTNNNLEWYADKVNQANARNHYDILETALRKGTYYLFDKDEDRFVEEVQYYEQGSSIGEGCGSGEISWLYKDEEVYNIMTWIS